jgi:hypothetical protein
MRKTTSLIVALMMAGSAVPGLAQESPPPQPRALADDRPVYETGGKRYETYQQCIAAKKRAQKRGTIAGAVVAGAGAAILGGNLGETALVAGGGALVGREIGRTSKKC